MSKIKLYNCDCMEYMKDCKDNQFSLVLVDPPYGIDQGGGKNHTRGKLAKAKDYKDFGDKNSMSKEYFNLLIKISENQIIWGANHFISKIPYDSSCWIVWDKDNGENDFADCELAWTSFNTSIRKIRYRWNGMLQQDMKYKEIRIHPTQKPVALYRFLLKKYAKEGDTILDTHLGSFSSAIASYDLGFDFTGCEIDKECFSSGLKRFNQFKAQTKMVYA